MLDDKPLYCIVDASEAALAVISYVKLYTTLEPWTLSVAIGSVPLSYFGYEHSIECLAYASELLLFHSVEAASTVIHTLALGGAVAADYHVVKLLRLRELLLPFVSVEEVSEDAK